jgi:hypothetical protein
LCHAVRAVLRIMLVAYLIALALSLPTLVVVNNKDDFSSFLSSIEGSQVQFTLERNELVFVAPEETTSTFLIKYDVRLFDNVLILSDFYGIFPGFLIKRFADFPSLSGFGGLLKVGSLIDFINLGGNVLVSSGAQVSEALRDFAIEFSVNYGNAKIEDYSKSPQEGLLLTSIVEGTEYIAKLDQPAYYSGAWHQLTGILCHLFKGKNPLIKPLLTAPDSAYVLDGKKLNEKAILGSNLVFISYFEALNNARVIFTGNAEFFSNK